MNRKAISLSLAVVFLMAAHGAAQQAEPDLAGQFKNYEVTIDGQTYDVNLDDQIQVKTTDGKTMTVTLRRKPYATYADKFVSFQHKSDQGVAFQDLGGGISQLISATATGTLIMIQEYAGMDPSMIVPLLLKEVTKESVEYGHKMTQEPVSRTLKSGVTLKGLRATLTYGDEQACYEVLAYGTKDRGIVVVTQIDKEFVKTDQRILDRFWDTLTVKF